MSSMLACILLLFLILGIVFTPNSDIRYQRALWRSSHVVLLCMVHAINLVQYTNMVADDRHLVLHHAGRLP